MNTEQNTDPETVSDTDPDNLLSGMEFPVEEETPAETDEAAAEESAGESPAEETTTPSPETEDAPADSDAEETPAEESVATPAESDATPEPAAATPRKGVTDADVAAQQRQQREARLGEVKKLIAAIDAKSEDDYDPFKDTKARNALQAEKDAILEQKLAEQDAKLAAQEQAQEQEIIWSEWGRKNPHVTVTRAKDIYAEEVGKLLKEYPGATHEQVQVAATQAWKTRTNLIKRQAETRTAATATPAKSGAKVAAKPGKPAPKITPGGAKVTPVGGAAARPPAARDPEDVLAAAIGGGIKGLLG